MLDDILDLFDRRKRQPDAERPSSTRKPGLPFGLPFLEDDNDEDERDRRRHEDERSPARRPSSSRSSGEGDWF